jgi:N-hydroxyarylamine O-acetyltransferase
MTGSSEPTINLDAYFGRIGYEGDRSPTLGTFRALHLAHTTHIPFENLDVLLGRPILIDLDSIQHKLVQNNRGGYCFEQNALFAAVLERLGFQVTRLAARVRYYTSRILPRTHMILKVESENQSWIADTGFGGYGLIEPIELVAGPETEQFAWKFRLREESETWILQSVMRGNWQDQFSFTLEPQLPVDYTLGNWFCSTHPESKFVQTLTAQLAGRTERHVLRNREHLIITPECERCELVPSEEALLVLLACSFGLHLPPGTTFKPTKDAELNPRVGNSR